MPLSVWLIDPDKQRGRRILPFLIVGVVLALYVLWALLNFHTQIGVRDHSVVYHNPGTRGIVDAALYIVAICGALFFSGYRYLVMLGVLNLVGLSVVLLIKEYALPRSGVPMRR